MAKEAVSRKVFSRTFRKRTSQGLLDRPKNKHKRKGWKPYRGQG